MSEAMDGKMKFRKRAPGENIMNMKIYITREKEIFMSMHACAHTLHTLAKPSFDPRDKSEAIEKIH